jgi:hypothetical protein
VVGEEKKDLKCSRAVVVKFLIFKVEYLMYASFASDLLRLFYVLVYFGIYMFLGV